MRRPRLNSFLLTGCAALALAGVTAPAEAQAQAEREYSIASQSLDDALRAFSLQSGIDVVFNAQLTRGRTAPSVSGRLPAEEALRRLLAGSGLTFRRTANGGFVVVSQSGEADREGGATLGDAGGERDIVVTGSRIRGARVSSPVLEFDQEKIRRSGHTSVGDVFRSIPQNFNGGQNPGVAQGASIGSITNLNITGGSSLNLRGLGPDATLTLLNGTRLPYDGQFQATDASIIPVAAISRIEILLDGASAIYGSDAVAGVANIILRRDYEGAEVSARYGFTTEGGNAQTQFTGLAGHEWGDGGFLIAADLIRNDGLLAGQRDYLPTVAPQVTIYPRTRQFGALLSAHQSLGSGTEIAVDAFFTDRLEFSEQRATAISTARREAFIWGISPSLRLTLFDEWNLRLHGAVGRNEVSTNTRNTTLTGTLLSAPRTCFCNLARSAGVELEGPLVAVPAGEIRLSLGGGYRYNSSEARNLITNSASNSGRARSYYAYAEAYAPLISDQHGIPLMSGLAINAAIRYENYDSFGDVLTPRAGLLWTLIDGLEVRASWGRSFKVPTLNQQFAQRSLFVLAGAPNGAPAGTTVLLEIGGNPELRPERAETMTAGVLFRPRFLRGLSLEAGWFDIDYRERVIDPLRPFSQAIANPAVAEFVIRGPTLAQQNAAIANSTIFSNLSGLPYNPNSVFAILRNRFTNASSYSTNGFDLLARYVTRILEGQFSADANLSWLESEFQLTPGLPLRPASGVSFFPVEFRARASGSWSRGGLNLSFAVNHLSGQVDTNILPNVRRDSFTTLDLVLSYLASLRNERELEFTIAVLNALDSRPPFSAPADRFSITYDSTNYNAIGRSISGTIAFRF